MLSQLLGAREPDFRLRLNELERSRTSSAADIHLSTEILRRTQAKIRELGLDPRDTSGEELYQALRQRLLDDNRRLMTHLELDDNASSAEILSAVQQFVTKLAIPRSCFAIKHSTIKRMLTNVVPTRTMRLLGYRSLSSMLKREPVSQIYAAAMVAESRTWRDSLMQQYALLQPSNFETRPTVIYYPKSAKWQNIANEFMQKHHHVSIAFKELGGLVVLPVNVEIPALAITTVLLLLEGMNDIRSSGAYLKLQQVRPDFGNLVARIMSDSPIASFRFNSDALSWNIIQHYYNKSPSAAYSSLFEPHLQVEDMELISAENAIIERMPALEFWEGTNNLAHLDDDQPVSFNMADVALSVANNIPFKNRVVQYMRNHVWCDLLARYLKPDDLEHILLEPNSAMTLEPALAQIDEN